jgi:hypothetical protein
MKYRQNTHDAPERPSAADAAPTRIPIIDERGNERGHTSGLGATAATVARFGVHNAKLKKIGGKPVWQGESGAFGRRRAEIKLQQQRATDRGSVSFNPTKPVTSARPKR